MPNLINPHLQIFTNFYLEYFIIVVNGVSIKTAKISRRSSIRINLNRHPGLLKIKLRRSSAPDTVAVSNAFYHPLRISIDDFLDYLSRQVVPKIEISSRGFNWNNLLNLSFLFSLLFSINSNTEFKLAIKDISSVFIQPLPALLFAALHDPQRLLSISLNLFYCRFNQKEVIKVLQMIFCEAIRLKKLKFTVHGKGMSLAKILEEVVNSGMTLDQTLVKLVLCCKIFHGGAVLEQIFGSYRNLEHLKIQINQTDLNDRTLQALIENQDLVEKLQTLHLSLRNKQITNASVEEFFRVPFDNLEDLKMDFKGSDIDKKAFLTLVKTRFRKLPKLKNLKLDFQDTRVSEALKGLLEFLLKKKLEGGQDEDRESCFRMVMDILESSDETVL